MGPATLNPGSFGPPIRYEMLEIMYSRKEFFAV